MLNVKIVRKSQSYCGIETLTVKMPRLISFSNVHVNLLIL